MSAALVNQVGSIQANSLDPNLYVMWTGCDDGHIVDTLDLRGSRLVKQDDLGHTGGVQWATPTQTLARQARFRAGPSWEWVYLKSYPIPACLKTLLGL
jgi:hypothetical protein